MTNRLEDEVQRIVVCIDNEDQNNKEREPPETTEQEPEPDETIHIHYFPDAIVILKDNAETPQQGNVVDSTLVQTKQPPVFIAYAICSFYLFLIFSCIAFQVYEILNPPIATVTIIPKSQQVTLNGTLQLGRVLQPLTISQSQITATTGKGHQDARSATGFITFYNGQLNNVTIAAGTILTASNGAQIITEQDATIPAASPPIEGQITVSAHAANTGLSGNIPAKAINEACCAISVLAVNRTQFYGGQDERNFQTVAKNDIHEVTSTLKPEVTQSMRGALQGQVQPQEQLFLLPCTPTAISDHSIGTEASEVKVTVSETCSAVAYNNVALIAKATELLSRQALQHLGTGYSLFGIVQVSITQATITRTTPTILFSCQGTWVYGISPDAQHSIKLLIAGKPRVEAIKVLLSLPGIERASIEGEDNSRLPKNITSMHFQIIIQGR